MTRPFGAPLGFSPQKFPSFNMAHLEVIETGIYYYLYSAFKMIIYLSNCFTRKRYKKNS